MNFKFLIGVVCCLALFVTSAAFAGGVATAVDCQTALTFECQSPGLAVVATDQYVANLGFFKRLKIRRNAAKAAGKAAKEVSVVIGVAKANYVAPVTYMPIQYRYAAAYEPLGLDDTHSGD